MNYRSQMKLLGCQQRKALREVESGLGPEEADRAGTGPVALLDTVVKDVLEEI